MESESSEKKQREREVRDEKKEKLISKLIKERMAERVWARDRLFRGLELDDLRSGDRRIFEDVEVAPTRHGLVPFSEGANPWRVIKPDRNFEKIVAGLVMEWKFEIFERVFSVHGEMSGLVEKVES